MNRLVSSLIFVFLFTGCATEEGWTPSPNEPRAFVTTLGADTTQVEVYTRTTSVIEGIYVNRIPSTFVIEYNARLDENQHIVRLEANQWTPKTNPTGAASSRAVIEIADGVASIVREGGQNPGTSEVILENEAIPTLGFTAASAFIFEQVAEKLQAGSKSIFLLNASGANARENDARVVAGDTVSMDYFGQRRKAWTDGSGQLLGISGAGTTNSSTSRRVEPFLVGSHADRWAALDVSGTGLGVPSPSATTQATVQGSDMEIRYSQPAKRGRDIWGGLVPEGTVWRTGANAATHFSTSQPLTIGGNALEAGTYTLWSMYQDGALHFIVNSQTDQWGTAHDPAYDLFTVVTVQSDRDQAAERFSISMESTDEGGAIHLDWDMTRFSVPFTVN